MITKLFLHTLIILCNIKSKVIQRQVLRGLARDSNFRRCIREIIKNTSMRRDQLASLKLGKYNGLLEKIMDRRTSKRVKVDCVSRLGPFLTLVLPLIESLLK